MERYITDTIYNNIQLESSLELELLQSGFYAKLSTILTQEEYIPIEETLNSIYSEVEKEYFCNGFKEGIRFLMNCMK